MVLSKIDKNINYLESNNLDKNDVGESYAYRATIFNIKIKFVLGKPNFQYIDNNIVYFNIYLVKDTSLVAKARTILVALQHGGNAKVPKFGGG